MFKLFLLLPFFSLSSFPLWSPGFTTASFPAGKCFAKAASYSPYEPVLTSKTANSFCINFREKPCAATQYNCCSKFYSNLVKIVLPSLPQCIKSVNRVTLNGQWKVGGVYFDVYNQIEAELRITALNLNKDQVLQSVICLSLKDACPSFETFCRTQNSTQCLVSFYDPITHECCPTCPLTGIPITSSSPPPPRGLPSPPPFSPSPPSIPPPSPALSPSPPPICGLNIHDKFQYSYSFPTSVSNIACNCSCVTVK